MLLTKAQARRFLLCHQGLLPPASIPRDGIPQFIRKVNAIQFDPIDMVGGNAHLVLQSRVDGYKPSMLESLLYEDRVLMDGWDKNMSILPVEDWPYFSRYRNKAKEQYGPRVEASVAEARSVISREGPVCSSDLDMDDKIRWPWGHTRMARAVLEGMYFWGELVVSKKVGVRKYYDFASKHLPEAIVNMPDPNPSSQEYFAWHVKRRVGSIGLLWNRASDAWLGITGMKSGDRQSAFAALEDTGCLVAVDIDGINHRFYVRAEDLEALRDSAKSGNADIPKGACFIAPLDNLLWDRKLVESLFGFHYTWEVYKPLEQRQFGYYVLPVLYGDRFVARFEPKFNRKAGTLTILNWWWEPGVSHDEKMLSALRQAGKRFIDYLGAREVEITTDDSLARRIWN